MGNKPPYISTKRENEQQLYASARMIRRLGRIISLHGIRDIKKSNSSGNSLQTIKSSLLSCLEALKSLRTLPRIYECSFRISLRGCQGPHQLMIHIQSDAQCTFNRKAGIFRRYKKFRRMTVFADLIFIE